MNGRGCPVTLFLTVLVTWSAPLAPSSFCQSITVVKNMTTARAIPPQFYGVNGQQRDSLPWDQTKSNGKSDDPFFAPAFQGLEYGILRFPGGTGANYWDWS